MVQPKNNYLIQLNQAKVHFLTYDQEQLSGCDIGYPIDLFDGLPIAIQFWHGDDEFFPSVRWLLDANALQYIKYDTNS